ncbi:MAG: hypothetical protein ATN36_02775 [Epulopiscium sp. Nele67-Bin005]|nr:MAG: hypothetical protein ATN36_02775 [Epulopiscium sp. Nele67-Bin005]
MDTPVETFEELFEFAETFNEPINNKFAFATDMANGYNGYTFLSPFGFRLFGEDGTDCNY